MQKIPKKVQERFVEAVKTYQPIIADVVSRDVSEADTVTVVKDVLSDLFGYHKYLDLTSEQQIRGTFCDLAVKLDGKVKFLVEVKAAGSDLNDSHLRQAVNYGVHEGIEWIVLTNSCIWKLYRVGFGQPVTYEEVFSFDLAELNPRTEDDSQRLFLLCKEALVLDAMDAFHQNLQLFNKYTVGHLLLSDAVVHSLRKEMRRLFPNLKVDAEQLCEILSNEIIKRDVLDGDKAKECQSRVKKANQKLARLAAKKDRANGDADAQAEITDAALDATVAPATTGKESPAAEAE